MVEQLPLLDEKRCNGCGDCVLVCPTACLEMAGPIPWLPRPLDCISCELCVRVCPTSALSMADYSPVKEPEDASEGELPDLQLE